MKYHPFIIMHLIKKKERKKNDVCKCWREGHLFRIFMHCLATMHNKSWNKSVKNNQGSWAYPMFYLGSSHFSVASLFKSTFI